MNYEFIYLPIKTHIQIYSLIGIGTYKVECSTSDELKECIMNSMEKGLKPLLEMGEIECES